MSQSRRNVVLLSVDALRADHLSLYGYNRNTSPFLDALAERGTVFQRAYAASSHTREGLPALLTGEHPEVFAKNEYRLVTESIATRLNDAGFSTAGFHSNSFVSHVFGFDAGFDRFYDDLVVGRSKLVGLLEKAIKKFVTNRGEYHARAEALNEKSLSWIDSLDDDPFFLWNHYMDVHGPYNPPDAVDNFHGEPIGSAEAQRLFDRSTADGHRPAEGFDESDRDLLVDLYDGEIRYFDRTLESFVGELEDRGLLEETYVVLTADHGEAFGDRGYYGHPRRLDDELLHIPLVVLGPEVPQQRVETPVSTIDVVPTVLDLLGVDATNLPGTSLRTRWSHAADIDSDDVVIVSAQGQDEDLHKRRYGIISRRWKYVVARDVESGELLSESATPLDDEAREERLEQLKRRLHRHSQEQLDDVEAILGGDHPDELDDRLKVLGYK